MNLPLELQKAHQLLKQFGNEQAGEQKGDRNSLQAAVKRVAEHSDYQILGICADTLDQGATALQQYAEALEYNLEPNFQSLDGAVYIKFNPRSGLCYASPYEGSYRGVLVSCQSAYESKLNEMYGYLPLDLFA